MNTRIDGSPRRRRLGLDRPAGPLAMAMVAAIAIAPLVALAGPAPGAQATPGAARSSPAPIHGQPLPSAPVPHVKGPIPGPIPPQPPAGAAVSAVTPATVAAFGYQEQEFFISGKANAYSFVSQPGRKGRWTVQVVPGSAAAYRTRIVVFTPVDSRRFSGTVVVEWDNVTVGADLMPDLVYDHATPFRDGDAYVGVSAQFVGVAGAKLNDPTRYGSLVHPGDSYSYDIFSQAGMAVWRDSAQVLGGLRPRRPDRRW